jgi:hypothetical protein
MNAYNSQMLKCAPQERDPDDTRTCRKAQPTNQHTRFHFDLRLHKNAHTEHLMAEDTPMHLNFMQHDACSMTAFFCRCCFAKALVRDTPMSRPSYFPCAALQALSKGCLNNGHIVSPLIGQDPEPK